MNLKSAAGQGTLRNNRSISTVRVADTPRARESEPAEIECTGVFLRDTVFGGGLLLRQEQADPVAAIKKRLSCEAIVGRSEALATVLREVELAAPLDIGVLITGPTGTGKTQLARAIHENSPRRHRPFVEINCGAVPDSLIECELFGALQGAYTGASHRIEGKIAAARGGTLFLDEVGELSSKGQSTLLQFLSTQQYCPLGSSHALTGDVRIVAATNVELRDAIDQLRFRSDLFFRLQGLNVRMPSLAERREDVIPLALHLCQHACSTHRLGNVLLSAHALSAIEAAEWPGNIRELRSAIESAVIRAAAEGSSTVEAAHVFRNSGAGPRDAGAPGSFKEQTRRFQRNIVLRALESTHGNVAAAGRLLDLTRAHMYNLIDAFEIRTQSESCRPARSQAPNPQRSGGRP